METLVTAWALWRVYKCVSTVYSTYRTGVYFYNTTVAIYDTTTKVAKYITGTGQTQKIKTPSGNHKIAQDEDWNVITLQEEEFEVV